MSRIFVSTFNDQTEQEFKRYIQSGRPPVLGFSKKYKNIRSGDIIMLTTPFHVFGVTRAMSGCSGVIDLSDQEWIYSNHKYNQHQVQIHPPSFFANVLSLSELQCMVGGNSSYKTNIYKGTAFEIAEAFITIPANKKKGIVRSKPKDEQLILSRLTLFISTHI